MGRSPAPLLKTFAECALMLFAILMSPRPAVAQIGLPAIDANNETDSAPLLSSAAHVSLEGRATQSVPMSVSRRPGPHGRAFVSALVAVPLVTYVGPLASRPSDVVYPAERFVVAQLIGGGYVVNPRFRFGAMGVFSEALTGIPTGAANWQLGGVAPVAIGTFNHFIVGGGPIIGYRSGGDTQTDIGMVILTGASIPIRRGLALNLVAPVTGMFARRTTASVAVAVGVSKVF